MKARSIRDGEHPLVSSEDFPNQSTEIEDRATWWFIPRIVSGLVDPSYKWTSPTYPMKIPGSTNPLTKWDEPPRMNIDSSLQHWPPRVGMEKLRRFTALFYERCFVDAHLDQFIAEHSEPHAERFANWIADALFEKKGGWRSNKEMGMFELWDQGIFLPWISDNV